MTDQKGKSTPALIGANGSAPAAEEIATQLGAHFKQEGLAFGITTVKLQTAAKVAPANQPSPPAPSP